MRLRLSLLLALVILAGLVYVVPSASAAYQLGAQPAVAMLQTPSQSPSPTSPTQPPPSGQSAPSDASNRADRTDTAYTNNSWGWGSFLVGLVLGAILGYFMGHRPASTVDVRRDRVA